MNPIAILFAVIVSALAVPAVYTAMSSQQQQELSTAAAIQMSRIEKAAEAYITANAGAIEGVATSTTPATITVPMLESTGYLPNGFHSVNPFGQTWEVQVIQPSAGNLQALVVSYGGNTVKGKVAGQVAEIAGASGGVIGGGSGEYAVPGCTGGEACGAYNGWSVNTSGYQNIQPGHFAALLAYSNGQMQSDYLYRVAVPGQPQLNQMQTNLDMGNNNVNNAQDVNVNQNVEAGPASPTGACVRNAQGHCEGQIEAAGTTQADLPSGAEGGIITRDVVGINGTVAEGTPTQYWQATMSDQGGGSVGSGGDLQLASPSGNYGIWADASNSGAQVVTNGTVQGGYVNSTGDVNAQYNSTASNAFSMDNGSWWANNTGDSSQTGNAYVGNTSIAGYAFSMGNSSWYATNNGDSSQTGNAYVGGQVTAGYDAVLGTAGGSANIGWGCGPNGSIATSANGNGQVLACQGGTWQAMGGNPTIVYNQSWGSTGGNAYYVTTAAMCEANGYAVGGGQLLNAGVYVSGGVPGAYNWYVWNWNDSINIICYN